MATTPFITTNELLKLPVATDGFSDHFVSYCHAYGWETIGDIVVHPLAELLETPGYLPLCHEEFMAFLTHHHRLHLIDVHR